MNPSNASESASQSRDASAQEPSSSSSSAQSGGVIGQTAEKVKTAAQGATGQVKAAATQAASRIKEKAAKVAEDQKRGVAQRLGGVGSAIHESAKSLEQEDPNIAWATHQVADRIQGVADYVRSRDFEGLRSDAERWARRHPVAFLGGLFLAGLVVGNLVKASRPRSSYLEDDGDEFSGLSAAGASGEYTTETVSPGLSPAGPSPAETMG
jgi:hypothetical protein